MPTHLFSSSGISIRQSHRKTLRWWETRNAQDRHCWPRSRPSRYSTWPQIGHHWQEQRSLHVFRAQLWTESPICKARYICKLFEMTAIDLGTMVSSMCWHDNNPSLVAVTGEKLVVWCYPNVAFIDKSLLPRSTIEKQSSQFGSEPAIQTFSGNSVTLRKQEGSIVSCFIAPYIAVLHQLLSGNKWALL